MVFTILINRREIFIVHQLYTNISYFSTFFCLLRANNLNIAKYSTIIIYNVVCVVNFIFTFRVAYDGEVIIYTLMFVPHCIYENFF